MIIHLWSIINLIRRKREMMNAHKKKSQRERACAYAAIMLAQLFNNLNRNRMQCDYTVLDTCRWWRKWWPINMYPKDNNVMRSAHCDKLMKKKLTTTTTTFHKVTNFGQVEWKRSHIRLYATEEEETQKRHTKKDSCVPKILEIWFAC